MKQFLALSIIGLFTLVSSPAGAGETLNLIKAECAKKWITKYSLVNYFIKKQVTAARELLVIRDTTPDEILASCYDKWGRGGRSNHSMVLYCVKKEVKAATALGETIDQVPPEIVYDGPPDGLTREMADQLYRSDFPEAGETA